MASLNDWGDDDELEGFDEDEILRESRRQQGIDHVELGDASDEDSDGYEEDGPAEEDKDVQFKWAGPNVAKSTPAFKGPAPGPKETLGLRKESSILDIFQLFLSFGFLHGLTSATNRYAQQVRRANPAKHVSAWKPVNIPEMTKFLGLSMLMGLVKKPRLKDYWTKTKAIATPYFTTVMRRDRWFSILRYFNMPTHEDSTAGPQRPTLNRAETVDTPSSTQASKKGKASSTAAQKNAQPSTSGTADAISARRRTRSPPSPSLVSSALHRSTSTATRRVRSVLSNTRTTSANRSPTVNTASRSTNPATSASAATAVSARMAKSKMT